MKTQCCNILHWKSKSNHHGRTHNRHGPSVKTIGLEPHSKDEEE